MKVMTVVGTRPEIIRLSRVVARLDEHLDHVLVHTGQNWDYKLNGVFFDEMGLRLPDHVLDVDTSTLGAVLGDTLRKTEQVLRDEKPDAFLVLGDTNSAISAVMAKRMQIPVYHMEAGNRCFDENVPEETNRRLVDHIADFNLVYTEHARRNLLNEGLHPRRIMLTGSPMREVLDHFRPQVEASQALHRHGLEPGRYFLVSAHRAETVDNPDRLRDLMTSLVEVRQRWGLPIIMSTHPRTRRAIDPETAKLLTGKVELVDPFGFFDYVKLQMNARCVLSDSGTISEEAAILNFPAVTPRDAIERPEALDAGTVITSGLRPSDVMAAVSTAIETASPAHVPKDYEVHDCSTRVLRFLLSTATRHRTWSGLVGDGYPRQRPSAQQASAS